MSLEQEFHSILPLVNQCAITKDCINLIIEKVCRYYSNSSIVDSTAICDLYVRCNVSSWNDVMANAACNGLLPIVEYCGVHGADDWEGTMAAATSSGLLHIIEYCELHGADDWDRTMEFAAYEGHLHIVEYCVIRGATNWNWSITCAARNGHQHVIDYCNLQKSKLLSTIDMSKLFSYFFIMI